jgi:hypothetical protein
MAEASLNPNQMVLGEKTELLVCWKNAEINVLWMVNNNLPQ